MNLLPDSDSRTEYVRFDKARIVRILERIVGDPDQLGESGPTEADGDPTTEHRRRLAEAPQQTRRLSTREARNALRAELNLPPK